MRVLFALALCCLSTRAIAAGPCETWRPNKSLYQSCIDQQAEAAGKIQTWLQRFDVDLNASDFDISINVALRQGKPFALLFARCFTTFQFDEDLVTVATCLSRSEEVEKRLGNKLGEAGR